MIEARAVVIEGHGDVSVLQLGTTQVREPGPGEILVDVAAAGLNRADTLQRRGFYPAPPGAAANVPGLEYAGTVARIGEGVREFTIGEAVMGIVAGGGMATRVCVHAREALRVPAGMSLCDAAAIPEVFLTAYDALVLQAEIGLGHEVLVHAIGSGIGTAALQLARAAGARVVGSSRSEDKLARCKPLGLELGILVRDGRFADKLRELTGGRLADAILDTVGAAYLAENVAALAPGGSLVVIGLMGGATAEFALGTLLSKRARVIGTVLRSRALEEKATLAQAFAHDVLPLFADGRVKPVIDCVLPMNEIRAAHTRMERNDTFGKIVMQWAPS